MHKLLACTIYNHISLIHIIIDSYTIYIYIYVWVCVWVYGCGVELNGCRILVLIMYTIFILTVGNILWIFGNYHSEHTIQLFEFYK